MQQDQTMYTTYIFVTAPHMSFSTCSANEYACSDSSCISLDRRCDLRVDCEDASDEKQCDKLIYDDDYLKSLPPPNEIHKDEPLYVDIWITVNSISEAS